jgi:hypothetical protein
MKRLITVDPGVVGEIIELIIPCELSIVISPTIHP